MSFPDRLKAVVFDLDGTLLDTAPEFIQVVQTLRAEYGRDPLPEAAIRAVVSDGARAMVSLALDLAQDHPDFETRRQRFLDLYAEDLGFATAPFPGIQPLLTALAESGRRWGISTNKPSYLAEPLMQRIALSPPAASLVCPDHVSRPKPDPEPLLLNCEQLGCAAHEVIYVGDHRRDIEAGRAAGMYTIAAAYGYIHAEDDPQLWGADRVATTPGALQELIAAAYTE